MPVFLRSYLIVTFALILTEPLSYHAVKYALSFDSPVFYSPIHSRCFSFSYIQSESSNPQEHTMKAQLTLQTLEIGIVVK